eukprot:TRINITY_DN2419_c0_g1_i2.p1 TRINITY_DN2419_c0_g1~~TRINITY_DN2419_c0_g1_i2.p1  ORF type:complete len:609 (+),score=28.33 TRINITY_DN2419_c0_g1_i2:716-2542(+)
MVYNIDGVPWALHTGIDLSVSTDINVDIEQAFKRRFDFVVIPLVHPLLQRDKNSLITRREALTKPDTVIPGEKWNNNIVVKITSPLDLDSPYDHVRRKYKALFLEELNYASHLGVYAVQISLPRGTTFNFAKTLNEMAIKGVGGSQIWIHCKSSEWEMFNEFRSTLDFKLNIGVSLELDENLPHEDILKRWCGENLKNLCLPPNLFVSNSKGVLILPSKHEAFVKKMFPFKVNIIVQPACPDEDPTILRNYLVYIFKTQPEITEGAYAAADFNDYLQVPLQPLKDNLESGTYQVFERDLAKYDSYEEAMTYIFKERFLEKEVVYVALVGAGRGPLMKRTLIAAEKTKRKVFMYVLEKNPNAMSTLYKYYEDNRKQLEDKVKIIWTDVRYWQPPHPMDVILSELLGSFGDNELSPECLDWGLHLCREDTISVPCKYTSYVEPVGSPYLFTKLLRGGEDVEKALQKGYVCRIQHAYTPCQVQPCFEFNHPNSIKAPNTRSKFIDFVLPANILVTGFAGYFDALLYKDARTSICPLNHTNDMHSWFPIFFPILVPLNASKGDTLRIYISRDEDETRVWYEWKMDLLFPGGKWKAGTQVHNSGGEFYSISKY